MEEAVETVKNKTPNRQYTAEFKQKALRLAKSIGLRRAAQELKMPEGTLEHWRYSKHSKKRSAQLTHRQQQTAPVPDRKNEVKTQVIQSSESRFKVNAQAVRPTQPSENELRAELKRLRSENATLQQENHRLKRDNETLERAATYFARAL